jgi:hypothetical protein
MTDLPTAVEASAGPISLIEFGDNRETLARSSE